MQLQDNNKHKVDNSHFRPCDSIQ